MRIKDVFRTRRSVYNFREDFKMTQADFDAIFDLAKHSPSVFNTQATRYLVTTDKEKQQKLKDLCYGQHKVYSASGVILILSKKDFLEDENIERVYGMSKKFGLISEDDYVRFGTQVKMFRNNLSDRDLEDEILRNAFISVGMLITAITILGFDSCPMHVHNHKDVKALFGIPDDLELLFMLPVGLGVENTRPLGYRHRVDELVSYEKYKN